MGSAVGRSCPQANAGRTCLFSRAGSHYCSIDPEVHTHARPPEAVRPMLKTEGSLRCTEEMKVKSFS